MGPKQQFGRDSNDDPFCYLIINLIIIDNNDNNSSSRTIKGDSCKLGEGFLSHIFRCKLKRCQFQEKVFSQDRVGGTSTHRSYNCIAPPRTTYINDHTSNVTYLITCDKWKIQCVGEAFHMLNSRFNWYNSCSRYPKKYSFC